MQLFLLLLFTLVLEVLIVGCTLAIAERRKLLAAVLSALIEPIRIVSLLFIIGSTDKVLIVALVSITCGIGNYLTILLFDKIRPRKKKHEQTP